MKHLNRGILVVVEGIDGSGKSTLANNLTTQLICDGWPCIKTFQPGSTPLGKDLRLILHDKNIAKTSQAEYLLFAADRSQNIQDIVIPALNNKQLVIADRMGDSSIVYQGYGRGLDISIIKAINAWTMQGINPDITIYVRVSHEVALHRLKMRNLPLTSIEQEPDSFFSLLVDGFDTIMQDKENVIIVDGNNDQDTVTKNVYKALISWISTNNLLH